MKLPTDREPFPWPFVMQFGLGILKLQPDQFWKMSLPELNAALKAHYPEEAKPVTREWLNSAMNIYPDQS